MESIHVCEQTHGTAGLAMHQIEHYGSRWRLVAAPVMLFVQHRMRHPPPPRPPPRKPTELQD